MLLLLAGALVVLGLPVLTATPASASPESLEIDKIVSDAAPQPGENFTFGIQVRCSEEDCLNAQITDAFPAGLDGFELVDFNLTPASIPATATW